MGFLKMYLQLVFVCNIYLLATRSDGLQPGFYGSSCPQAELIVRQIVETRFDADPTITAALLRMHFHDCFVRGCDASLLLDSSSNHVAEKDSGPNLSVRGFDLIDDIKSALESACPATVSCADIIALSTRDAVSLAGGPSYAVPTGRRDGVVSNGAEVNQLPAPTFTVSQAQQSFATKGLNLTDLIILLGGGHTVGVAHCSLFQDRLFNFRGTGRPDPTMDRSLLANLRNTCGTTSTDDPTTFLDQGTPFKADNGFYAQIRARRGVLQIDQELALDNLSSGLVTVLASNLAFFRKSFGDAMIKLGSVQVLQGNAGQIRTDCRIVN